MIELHNSSQFSNVKEDFCLELDSHFSNINVEIWLVLKVSKLVISSSLSLFSNAF